MAFHPVVLSFDVFRPHGHARTIPQGYTLAFVRRRRGKQEAIYGITSRPVWFDPGADDCMVILDEVTFEKNDVGGFSYRKTGRTKCAWTSTYVGSWGAAEAT